MIVDFRVKILDFWRYKIPIFLNPKFQKGAKRFLENQKSKIKNQNPLCLFASKIKIAAATDTFMLSISPCIGIMMF